MARKREGVFSLCEHEDAVNREALESSLRVATKLSTPRSEWQTVMRPLNERMHDRFDDALAIVNDFMMLDTANFEQALHQRYASNYVVGRLTDGQTDELSTSFRHDFRSAIATLPHLENIATDDLLERMKAYRRANYGKPWFLPDMLGEEYCKKFNLYERDGLFFQASTIGVVRAIFGIDVRRVRRLVEAGFIMRADHIRVFKPMDNRNYKSVCIYNLDAAVFTKLKKVGATFKVVHLVTGIDLDVHKEWYTETLEEYAMAALARSTHNYAPSRKSRSLRTNSKVRKDARLIYTSNGEYLTAQEYAFEHSITQQAVSKRMQKLPYYLTVEMLQSGMVVDAQTKELYQREKETT